MALITAERMSKKGFKPMQINSIVKNQIMIIDTKLRKADKSWGKNVLTHVLPSDFDIPGLSKEKSQKLIYSQIITKCEDAGYKVRIAFNKNKNKNVLALVWESEISEEDMNTMDSVIERAVNMKINSVSATAETALPPAKTTTKSAE